MKTINGIIHGRTIELADAPGLADGAEVEVVLRAKGEQVAMDGIRRSAGALADDSQWDAIMADVQHARGQARRSETARL